MARLRIKTLVGKVDNITLRLLVNRLHVDKYLAKELQFGIINEGDKD
ncbi:MAG: hypothetical protein IIC40_03830 [Candidatus Marinimicrobia bacterium]|nr:hypothetical protein [Candidatus Neomarinimicrobiota bacterium]